MAHGTAAQEAFADRKFGLFIHWGLYSILGRGEWAQHNERIPNEEYAELADRFTGERFDADFIARLAVECGMKYIVMTTKHHDGFCLYNSALTDFTTAKTAAKRDFIGELANACHKHGLGFHPYYSLWDWNHPDFVPYDREPQRPYLHERWQRYVQFYQGQVRELCTNYGSLTGMWFDTGGGVFLNYDFDTTTRIVHDLHPDAAVMCADYWVGERSGVPAANGRPTLAGSPLFDTQFPGVFEICETVNDHWGYCPGDANFKSPVYLRQYFLETVGYGGNFLLNAGPLPDGSLDGQSVETLRALGSFVWRYERAFFGARAERHPRVNPLGVTTKRGEHAYFFITDLTRLMDELSASGDPMKSDKGEVAVAFDGLKARVAAANLFDGAKLAFKQTGMKLDVTLPRSAFQWPETVIDVRFDSEAVVDGMVRPEADGRFLLTPEWAALFTPRLGAPRFAPDANGSGRLVNWTQLDARAEWLLEVPVRCRYEVFIEQSCPAGQSGSPYVLRIKQPADTTLRLVDHLTDAPREERAAIALIGITLVPGVTQPTASWGEFRRVSLGIIELPAGLSTVEIIPQKLMAGVFMDVRAVELFPAAG